MEKHYLIVILFITLAVIGGLIIVHLQNKGIVKPVLTQTATGFDFMSGGIIAFFSILAGGSFIYNTGYPIYAVVYVVGFVGIYIAKKEQEKWY